MDNRRAKKTPAGDPSKRASPPGVGRSLEDAVTHGLERYFEDLEGVPAVGVYEMVIRTVERPMLEVVMRQADGNQVKAAAVLGINRNTLRKKLQQHGLLHEGTLQDGLVRHSLAPPGEG